MFVLILLVFFAFRFGLFFLVYVAEGDFSEIFRDGLIHMHDAYRVDSVSFVGFRVAFSEEDVAQVRATIGTTGFIATSELDVDESG